MLNVLYAFILPLATAEGKWMSHLLKQTNKQTDLRSIAHIEWTIPLVTWFDADSHKFQIVFCIFSSSKIAEKSTKNTDGQL